MSISGVVVDRAEISFHQAPDEIRGFVGCPWVAAIEPEATIRVVPDGSATMAVFCAEGQAAEWYFRGPVVRPHELRFRSPGTLIGVRLRPAVGFLVTGVAAYLTIGRRLPLASLPACRSLVAGPEPATAAEQLASLRAFLIDRLEGAAVHAVVARALAEIEAAHGRRPIPDLATRCGVSPRHLHRLMRTWVGFGPKRFSQVVRLQTALAGIDGTPERSPAALAAASGYFDQAHLTADLSRFTGATPGQLARGHVADFSKTRCR